MNRRSFLSIAGAGMGYSVFVRVEGQAGEVPPDAEAIRQSFDSIAPPETERRRSSGEPHMRKVTVDCDVLVAGGGMAGVCAALAAARNGARVVLCQDRSRLGGNASSEVKMHIVGADVHGSRPGWREGGLIEELRLEDAVHNPQRCWEYWDLLLYSKVKSEPRITLLLESTVYAAETRQGLIRSVMIRCDKTEHLYQVRAKIYLDCTGDCRLALEAGAEMRRGREARSEFDESLAVAEPDRHTLGSSILFTARDYGRPMAFVPPPWARKITRDQLKFRPVSSWEYGYWWIEWGGAYDTIRDQERIRFELLSIVLGVWDYIKNSGDKPGSANWALDWLGMVPGKRGSRRIVGDYLLTEHDLRGTRGQPADAVSIGGWPMDDHPPGGFDLADQPPFTSIKVPDPYNIPLRCLISRNIGNLMMAGRNISCSHVAFTSTRVMATCSALGQAAGTAAALCVRRLLRPRQLHQDPARLRELQQALLRDDQSLIGIRNEDPQDLARQAEVSASDYYEDAFPEHVIDGLVRDLPGRWEHRWAAKLGAEGAWLQLAWERPVQLRQVQITFDTGFQRQLTLSSSDGTNKTVIRAPQPETVRDYIIEAVTPSGSTRALAQVRGNYLRLRRHNFELLEVTALRIKIQATNGSDTARIYEVRAYG